VVHRQTSRVQDQRQILPQGDTNGRTAAARLGDALESHAFQALGLQGSCKVPMKRTNWVSPPPHA
jgi:hypothetical protein